MSAFFRRLTDDCSLFIARCPFKHLPAIVLFLFFLAGIAPAQNVQAASDTNEIICMSKFKWAAANRLQEKPIEEVVAEIGKSFIGTDYAANMLESPGEEKLVVALEKLDCVTLYENALVLARCIKKGLTTYADYKRELQRVRYRDGIIDGYPSRLHYTSDYFYDNEKKGILKDMTSELGGIPMKKKINFMSTHEKLYSVLRRNPDFVSRIRNIEDSINARTILYIPKSQVRAIAWKIRNGDILGITTSIDGMDCSHTGIAVWKDGELRFLHAPVPGSRVQITSIPLWEYLAKNQKQTGIIVARAMRVSGQ
jgi:hypothetical protein